MVFIRLGWCLGAVNTIENWIRNRTRSRLCNDPLNTHIRVKDQGIFNNIPVFTASSFSRDGAVHAKVESLHY